MSEAKISAGGEWLPSVTVTIDRALDAETRALVQLLVEKIVTVVHVANMAAADDQSPLAPLCMRCRERKIARGCWGLCSQCSGKKRHTESEK